MRQAEPQPFSEHRNIQPALTRATQFFLDGNPVIATPRVFHAAETDSPQAFAQLPAPISRQPAVSTTAPASASRLIMRTLGGFAVEQVAPDGSVTPIAPTAWRHGRSLALMHYLLGRPGFASAKSAVRDALWPGIEPQQGATYLSNALWNLRKALQTTRNNEAFAQVTDTIIRLNVLPLHPPQTHTPSRPLADTNHAPLMAESLLPSMSAATGIWFDTVAFEASAKQVRGIQAPEARLAAARQALMIYTGDFLPECVEPHWVVATQERLREQWATLLVTAAEAYVRLGDVNEAIETLERLLAHLPDHERGARYALELLLGEDRRREARALADHLRASYKEMHGSSLPASLRELAAPLLASKRTTVPLPRAK